MHARFNLPTVTVAMATIALLVASVPVQGQETAPHFTITIDADGNATVAGLPGIATLRHSVAGENYTIDLNLTRDHTVARVVVQGGLDVERPRQLVPELDDSAQHPTADHLHPHFFTEVFRDVGQLDSPANVVNFTGAGKHFQTHLGIVGPGPGVLTLTRDIEAPFYQIDGPTDVTHRSFMQVARSDEFALGVLAIAPTAGGKEVVHPTSVHALEQTFPVQGLKPDTEYTYTITFIDWAGNAVTADPMTVRTGLMPVVQPPATASYWPLPDSTHEVVDEIVASFVSESPIGPSGVRLFVDKQPVLDGWTIAPDEADGDLYRFRWVSLTPLDEGPHAVSLEVTNDAGGVQTVRWSFTVGDGAEESSGLAVVPVVVALVGVIALRRRA